MDKTSLAFLVDVGLTAAHFESLIPDRFVYGY